MGEAAGAGPVWGSLLGAARALCPPLELIASEPGRLRVVLAQPGGAELVLSYRSERGLFLRTYFLVAEVEFPGSGPAEPGELRLRRRALTWKRPRPAGWQRWRDAVVSPELPALARRLRPERLSLKWEPELGTWRLRLETLTGGATVTFFPPLTTPTLLLTDEAEALVELLSLLLPSR